MEAEVVPAQLGEGTGSTGMKYHAKGTAADCRGSYSVWGDEWRNLTVKARCDNMAVVATIKAGTCKERKAMHLMRCLAFIEATRGFTMNI